MGGLRGSRNGLQMLAMPEAGDRQLVDVKDGFGGRENPRDQQADQGLQDFHGDGVGRNGLEAVFTCIARATFMTQI